MECTEFQELISPAVDGCLNAEELVQFNAHLEVCESCRYEYDIESATRSLVRSRVPLVRAPGALLERIAKCIELEEMSSARPLLHRWRPRNAMFKPLIAFGLACIAVFLLLNIRDTTPGQIATSSLYSLPTNDVIHQSMRNYMGVLQGDIKPEIISEKPEDVKGFFSGKTEFDVLVPSIHECKLVGAGLNDYSGATLAHVIYSHNDDVIYMYEACWETVMQGDKLILPEAAKGTLIQRAWFSSNQPEGYSIVLWRSGNTLCSAVAKMDEANLRSYLKGIDGTARYTW